MEAKESKQTKLNEVGATCWVEEMDVQETLKVGLC